MNKAEAHEVGKKAGSRDASISFQHIELFLQVTKTELIHFQTEIFRCLIECCYSAVAKINGTDFIRLIQVKKKTFFPRIENADGVRV